VLTRRDRKSGERSTCREQGKEISRQKGRSSWRTKKYGGMKRSFVEPFTIRGNGKEPTKKVCLTPVEHKRIKEGIPRETVIQESFWRMRPDGIAVLPPEGNKGGTFCILEHKRMSDSFEHYLVRAKNTAENQYVSLRSVIGTVIQRQRWKVDQVSFGSTRSVAGGPC
jgi:hypothetical protein